MWTMILKYIPEAEISQQISSLNGGAWFKEHGNQISWQHLIEAFQQYIANYSQWSISERTNYWAQTIGGAQSLLPAHVINEYSRPEQSFCPCPDYLHSSSALTTITGVDDWKKILNSPYVLGENFA